MVTDQRENFVTRHARDVIHSATRNELFSFSFDDLEITL